MILGGRRRDAELSDGRPSVSDAPGHKTNRDAVVMQATHRRLVRVYCLMENEALHMHANASLGHAQRASFRYGMPTSSPRLAFLMVFVSAALVLIHQCAKVTLRDKLWTTAGPFAISVQTQEGKRVGLVVMTATCQSITKTPVVITIIIIIIIAIVIIVFVLVFVLIRKLANWFDEASGLN